MTRIDNIRAFVQADKDNGYGFTHLPFERCAVPPRPRGAGAVSDPDNDIILTRQQLENDLQDLQGNVPAVIHIRTALHYLDLVERAVPIIEMNTSPKNLVAQQWLRDVRSGSSNEDV